jgi:hypothetical protein
MPYIGHSPEVAQRRYESIDDISGSFNGSTTSFALQVGGVTPSPFPVASENVLISVGGVIQEPDGGGTNGFQLTGTNIVFSSAPASGQSFFGVILAGADYVTAGHAFPDGDAGTPSITFSQDLDTGVFRGGSGITSVSANNNKIADFGPTAIVFNEDGDNVDFRVEGDTKANLFVVDAGNDKITLDGDLEPTTINGITFPTDGALSHRNMIMNGDMRIDQRNNGSSTTPSADQTKVFDRWMIRNAGGSGRFSVESSGTSPNNIDPSMLLTVTTTDTPAAGEFYGVEQRVEGYVLAPSAIGSSTAKALTLSFYVRSSLTGTYCCSFRNAAADRSFVAEYTISAANTWEFKTIQIAAKTDGTWNTTNTVGAYVNWTLGSGGNFEGSTGWQSANRVATSNQVDWINTSGATFHLTGVQLELGEKVSPFEYKSYGDELARCQRYFQTSFTHSPGTGNTDNAGIVLAGGSTTGNTTTFIGAAYVQFAPDMRAAPTVTTYDLATPRGTNKVHRHTYGSSGSNGNTATITDINTKSFIVRSDSGISASGIIFHYEAEAEL